jgi:hypothetical protein
MRFYALWLAVALSFSAAPVHAEDEVSPAAIAYIDAALKVMQENFLHKDKIDWTALRRETLSQAGAAQTAVDTYPAIRFALAKLGDRHSYLQLTPDLTRQQDARQPKLSNPSAMPVAPPRKQSFPFPSPFQARRVPEGVMLQGSASPIADVVIPLFSAPNIKDLNDYATSVQNIIADLALQNPCGWVVDLRGNGGGNIWAMMAGVGPLLGEGEPGALLHDTDKKSKWFYESGKAGLRGDAKDPFYASATREPVNLGAAPPVAVLIDRGTGSSGEGIAIAFRARPETRFFGETTYGAATSTFPFPLSDGAQLYLVVGVMLDRNGNEYPDGVKPDQEILSEATISTKDPVIRAATDWLSGLKACRALGK